MHIVWFHNVYCLLDTRVSDSSGKMGKECGMHVIEGNLEQIFH
jgi:hypothetical protein